MIATFRGSICFSNLHKFKNLSFQGISIHIGSQITDFNPIKDSLLEVLKLINEIEKKAKINLINIGGGIGVSYNNKKSINIINYRKVIDQTLRKWLNKNPNVLLISEPGRILTANTGIIVSKVLYRKKRKDFDFLIIDASMTENIRPALYKSSHIIIPVKKENKSKLKKTNVVGPVCESSDFLAKNIKLSESLKRKDLIAILSCGAYCTSMESTYNSRPLATEILAEKGKCKIIRKRTSFI